MRNPPPAMSTIPILEIANNRRVDLFGHLLTLSSLLLLSSCTLDPSWADSPEGQAWRESWQRNREELQWQESVEARKSRN